MILDLQIARQKMIFPGHKHAVGHIIEVQIKVKFYLQLQLAE